ncbi:hypothetical protein MSG28_003282 [Choristoneura fumiferana]|uniref:Uncharacterized protein n=1 Tax=Choristoneura fumiferana TaxID=7141 RepID=A0ACC0KEW3_CHOFU|nr:hypothetical protein MSG28_003282 [Choristoneura fumiferana]
MLEESKMDKKSINRSSQLQSRVSAADGKKNTELTHKPWPRGNKKREGPGSAPKNEPNRKNPAQRGRGQVDRRPRARGIPGSFMGGTEIARLEDDQDPEIGSVYAPGSKKQNWNHLLNFMYPTRGGPERRDQGPRRQGLTRAPQRHSHDLYLRAYCQFVVKEDGDYRANILDPDVPIKWEQIEEIIVRSTGRTECPICLGTPVAGRTGLCGHVYCWPCVLHYAATHDKQPPPCPVCHAALQVKEMKPTRMLQWEFPSEEITMCLVRRLRGSTVVEVAPPRGTARETAAEAILPLTDIDNAPYAKFFAANKQQVRDILNRERKEIENQILAEIDTTEIVFMEQVLEMLKLKEESINLQCDLTTVKEDIVEIPTVYEKQEINQERVDWFDVTEEGAACVEVLQEQVQKLKVSDSQFTLNPEAPEFNVDDLDDNLPEEFPLIDCAVPSDVESKEDSLNDSDKQNQAKYFYFYQANDGQQVFLNSLNVRILNASWGALAAAPSIITGRVLHRETLSLAEQTRKHMPYTAHLPLHCSFDIVEIELKPPYATDTAIKSFSEELDRRARIRARHERDERRRERAYHRALEGPPRPDFNSDLMFPPTALSSPPLTEPVVLPPEPSPSSSGLSFAKMAGTGGMWRVRKVSAPVTPPPEEEGSAPRALVLSDAIEAALQSGITATPSSSGKKSKKSKHKVLFATGMHRAA